MRPPARRRPSSTTTSKPCSFNPRAAANPAMPAPTTSAVFPLAAPCALRGGKPPWLSKASANAASKLRRFISAVLTSAPSRRERENTLSKIASFHRRFFKSATTVVPRSKPRRCRFQRRLKAVRALDLQLALEHLVAAGGEQRVEVRAAEAEIRELAVGRGDDAVHPPGLIANLDAHQRGSIEPAVAVHAQPVHAAVVGVVGHVQMVIPLLVGQRAVGLDLI